MKIKKILKIIFQYGVPLAFIGWMVVSNPWGDLIDRVVGVSFLTILVAFVINFGLIFPLKTLRWRLAIQKPPSFWTIYASLIEGQLANIVVGMGVNDLVRSARLRRHEKGTFPEDLGTALADRICEYIALSFLLVASTLTPWVPLVWLGVPFLYFCVVALILLKPNIVINKLRRWPKACRAVRTIGQSLSLKRLVFMVGLSFVGWMSEMLMIQTVLYALHLPYDFGLAVLILVAINVAIAIPGPPANLGTFETGAILALMSADVGHDAAVSFALIYHAFHMVFTTVVGSLVWLLRSYRSRKGHL